MLSDFITDKKSLFSDGVQTVLRGQENRNRVVVLHQGNLVNNVRTETRGVCARVCKNGVSGFSSLAEYSSSAAERVLKEATSNAFFLDEHSSTKKPMAPSFDTGIVSLNSGIKDCEQTRIAEACKQIDDYIVSKYPSLASRSVVYTENTMEKIICSSDCYSGHVAYPRAHIYVTLVAITPSGSPVQLYETFGGYGGFDDHFTNLDYIYPKIDELYETLMDKREGVYADAGYKTVILGGKMAGMLAHEAVGHTVEADLVMGGSVAGKLLNCQVASSIVSMTDFAHTAFGKTAPLPVYLDDEGVKAEDAVLIENGILKGYMNNRETACCFGVKPVGNARGWDFSDEPLIRMRNTTVLPGKDKLEDMIASIDDGYYLIDSGNGQADLTGEFMFGVTMGYEIKNGKLGKALLDTTVSGIAFDMLKTVDMISDNIHWTTSGTCGKKQPMAVSMGGPELRCKIMIGGR